MKYAKTFLVIIAAIYMIAVEFIGCLCCILLEFTIGCNNRIWRWFNSEVNGIANIVLAMTEKEKNRLRNLD